MLRTPKHEETAGRVYQGTYVPCFMEPSISLYCAFQKQQVKSFKRLDELKVARATEIQKCVNSWRAYKAISRWQQI